MPSPQGVLPLQCFKLYVVFNHRLSMVILLRSWSSGMTEIIFGTGLPSNAICLNSDIAVYGIITKRPFRIEEEYQYENACQCIEHEKEIYRRLGECDGVIPYLDLSAPPFICIL